MSGYLEMTSVLMGEPTGRRTYSLVERVGGERKKKARGRPERNVSVIKNRRVTGVDCQVVSVGNTQPLAWRLEGWKMKSSSAHETRSPNHTFCKEAKEDYRGETGGRKLVFQRGIKRPPWRPSRKVVTGKNTGQKSKAIEENIHFTNSKGNRNKRKGGIDRKKQSRKGERP